MEFTVNTGKGYVPAEKQPPGRRADRPTSRSTAIYSPVKPVSYRVEATREGQTSTTTS
jgi:DNA-directed RNA polymerase subunit alpha